MILNKNLDVELLFEQNNLLRLFMKFLDTYVKKFISDEKYNDVFLKANKIGLV